MHTTSASLLERLRQPRAQEAWERFVELYTPLLFHWARSLGLQNEAAADLVQDVFVLLLEKLPEFRYDPQKGFRAWLKTVTLNHWRNQRRKRSATEVNGTALEELPEPADTNTFWETEYREHLVARCLTMIQSQFRPNTWKAFWETTVQKRPPEEVAQELGLSANAVYLARARVLAYLRRELAGLLT